MQARTLNPTVLLISACWLGTGPRSPWLRPRTTSTGRAATTDVSTTQEYEAWTQTS